MLVVSFSLFLWLTFVSSTSETPSFKGCYSTNVVEQYAFYYKIGQSLPLEECFAACNNRLTTHLGLKVDDSIPIYNFVYCGNDLLDVSPKVDDSRCLPCEENNGTLCGGNDVMAVYSLRGETPLALLLATDRGIELFTDNTTTVRVPHYDFSPYKFLDYVYTEDSIIYAIDKSILRSFYNPLTTKYIGYRKFYSSYCSYRGLGVDFSDKMVYLGSRNGDLYGLDLETVNHFQVNISSNVPMSITVDPYNRSVIFITELHNYILVFFMDSNFVTHHYLSDADKINALAMDSEGRSVYAILTQYGYNDPDFVSLNYTFSQMRVLFSGPELINASVLEVYKGEAFWLVVTGNSSYIYHCKLRPRCNKKDLTVYKTNENIYDFAIYHPEKQTRGEKSLCEHKTCSYRCSKFTPFSSKCVCPSGMRLNPDDTTCSDLPTTQHTTQSSTQTSDILSTTNGLEDLLTTSSSFMEKTDKLMEPQSSFEYFVLISIAILLTFMFGLCVLNCGLYRKNSEITKVVSQRLELNVLHPRNELIERNSVYMEIPIKT